jgi:catechol 2,3-dioxygenase-like lactoylglutathione lyase family enzyme
MINALDHLVLTVRSVEASVAFYTRVLGCQAVAFEGAAGETRHAILAGSQKINLQPADSPVAPHAQHPTPGAADLCLRASLPLVEVERHVRREGAEVVLGPVWRVGARARLWSIYLRDPDGNLIEIANEVPLGEPRPEGAPRPPDRVTPLRAQT